MSDDERYARMGSARTPFTMPHSTIQETSLGYQVAQQFIADNAGDMFFDRVSMTLSKKSYSVLDVVHKLKEYTGDGRMVMPHDKRNMYITGGSVTVLIHVKVEEYETALKFKIDITGDPAVVIEITASLKRDFERENIPVVNWWFQGRHGPEMKGFYMPNENLKILPEYYPDTPNPEQYLADYMDSNESILLMTGPPGTGKTTLLRFLIQKYKLAAHVIYDERLMDNDGPFQTFLFGDDYPRSDDDDDDPQNDMMIIEDADTILLSRERDNNKLMSRFLNVSDGLIKLPNKKLVFTTNIQNFETMDSALLRPGRCFGILQTRALDPIEAKAAALAAGKRVPTGKHEYTLAQIFNQEQATQIRGVGFGTRHK